jgi:hypothetical protein
MRVRRVFLVHGITNKDQRARFLAARFPELARCVPPERELGDSENPRTAIFDAAAMAVVLFRGNEVCLVHKTVEEGDARL